MILVQSYNAMFLSIRKTISHFISYKPRNKKELTAIFEELIFLDKEEGEALTRFAFDIPYDFLYVDVNTNSLYKKFDRITQRDASKDKKRTNKGKTKGGKCKCSSHIQSTEVTVGGGVGGGGGAPIIYATYAPPPPKMPTSMPFKTGQSFAPKKFKRTAYNTHGVNS